MDGSRGASRPASPALPGSARRGLVIANPAAGQIGDGLIAEIATACAGHGLDLRIQWTSGPGDATTRARIAVGEDVAGFTLIIAVGGDGTVREVATGMADGRADPRRHAMFVVPAGTGNSNYRAHWGDLSWQRALDRALTGGAGGVRMLDLARYVEGGALVVLGAGAGLTAQVLADARDVALTGRDRLQAGLDRALAGYRPYPGRVLVDGTVVHEGGTLFANVGGGRYRAWQFEVLPHSALDDGWLDVCVVGTGCGVDAMRLQALMREGRHLDLPDVRYARGREVVFERTDGEPLCFEHDGELRTDTGAKATLQIVPGVLPVLCAGTPERVATPASVGGARS